MRPTLTAILLAIPFLPPAAAGAELPDAIATQNEVPVATVQAVGAQVYECRQDSAGKLVWQFREPIATLLLDGKTVGRHYAGPNWEMADGSVVTAKVSGRAPAASADDVPLLKLDVATRRGAGRLSGVTTIQRLNTRGGVAAGECGQAGLLLSVPYTADYAFLRTRV